MPDYIVGSREGDTIHPLGSVLLPCVECGSDALINPVGQGVVRGGYAVLCIDCFQKQMLGKRESSLGHVVIGRCSKDVVVWE
mgnify:CR=1 FL=1